MFDQKKQKSWAKENYLQSRNRMGFEEIFRILPSGKNLLCLTWYLLRVSWKYK